MNDTPQSQFFGEPKHVFARIRYESARGADKSEEAITPPEHYRAKAAEMLKLAEESADEPTRQTFVLLAANWESLAQTVAAGHSAPHQDVPKE
jgi:hypothetical protein